MNFQGRYSTALMLASVMLLAACATTKPKNYASESELITDLGKPVAVLEHTDGTRTLEYSTQPKGPTALRARVDAQGKVIAQWDALDDKHIAQIQPGMTKDEVTQRLGPYRSERVFPTTHEEILDWSIRHQGAGMLTLLNVHFVDNKVTRISRFRLYANGEALDIGERPRPNVHIGVGTGIGIRHGFFGFGLGF